MNSISPRDRRDYCPYFSERDAVLRRDLKVLGWVALGVLIATVLFSFVPTVGHAQEKTPKKDYPLTNAGVCMRLHKEGMTVQGASMKQVVALCAKEGVQL